jgi:hypothetical protein
VGYVVGVGLTYATAYWFPMTSTYCTLTTIETTTPACALTNTAYGQVGVNAFIPKPLTTFALYPAAYEVYSAPSCSVDSDDNFAAALVTKLGRGYAHESCSTLGTLTT